jgi:hypothetical protein
MASREPHSGGLDWDIDDPGEHARTNEQSTGGNGWFSRPTDPTKEMAIFLVSLRKRFTGNFQGHDSAAEVRLWFTKMEDKLITRTAISNRLFPTITPALASNWAASLTTTLFTDEVPPRVTSQNNALHQSVAEYNAAVILFREVRQRFIAPLSNLLLYELVSQEKRAEIAQALTAVRGGVQEVGDVGDYIALRDLLSSPSYTLIETLDDAVCTRAGHSQRQHVHQQHRGGPAAAQQVHPQHRGSTGGPAAAAKTTAPHGRHVERFRTAGPADKRVAADYIC